MFGTMVTWLLISACGSGDGSLESMLREDLGLSGTEAECTLELLAEDQIDDAAVESIIGDGDAANDDQAAFDEILTTCADMSERDAERDAKEAAAGSGSKTADAYGDDAELDRLWDECARTGTASCDELFNESPEGSAYEAFGDSCGNRGPAVACAPDALGETGQPPGTGSPDPQTRGDDPTLDLLWDQCAAADGQACLALEFQAPPGSGYQDFGASCGNRPEVVDCASLTS